MPNRSYARGATFERKVCEWLLERGYYPLRSPRSGGPVDILAYRGTTVLAIQCKKNGRCDPTDWNELLEVTNQFGGIPLIAFAYPRQGIRYYRPYQFKVPGNARQPWTPYEP